MTVRPLLTVAQRFAALPNEERGEVLQSHLTAAERVFLKATGQPYHYFGIEAVAYYVDWFGVIAPELAIELLEALAGVHQCAAVEDYQAARERLDRAKLALNQHFLTNNTRRGTG